MGRMQQIIAASALAAIAFTAPTARNDDGPSPCAQVSSSVAAQSGIATPTVGAEIAYECINSVPLNQTAALKLIKSIRPYLDWQSTTAWLKDPPEEYVEKVQEPVDLFGELDDIEEKVKSGHWTKEYEFGWALYTLTQSTHDGHLVYVPDSVGEVFNFGRPVPLVSVSLDGQSPPLPYAYQDILASTLGSDTEPSSIEKINGQDALEYLENFSQFGSLQDRDALYNNVFYELAIVSLGSSGAGMGTFTGGGRGRWVYPGPTTELTFANGSSVQYPNFARVLIPFTGIESGEDLYRLRFSTPENTTTGINVPGTPAEPSPTPSDEPSALAATPAPGYPTPIVRAENNAIGGYYIDQEGYEDIAVLSIPSFLGGTGPSPQENFQTIGKGFVQQAVKDGKKKLIIDVQANGGGTILLGYDVFKYLFPDSEAFAAGDRFRSFETTDLIGDKFSDVAADFPRTLDPELEEVEGNIVSSVFNYRTDQKVDGTPFESWDEKIGPVESKGDQYSELIRWNLSDVLTPYNGGIYISNEPVATEPQPFAPEDIIVITEGYCASTCTIFSELMRQVAGVQYVAMGGRSSEDNIQAIGGVKGTNNFPWGFIQQEVALVYNWSTPDQAKYYDTTELIDYNDDLPFLRSTPGVNANTNFRDGIRPDDEEAVPLQFVYEEADCRIFYTPEMTVDVTAIWKSVADSAWGEEDHCVAGGLGGGYGRKKRSLTRSAVRRGLSEQDYPMDVYTDLSQIDDRARGYMQP